MVKVLGNLYQIYYHRAIYFNNTKHLSYDVIFDEWVSIIQTYDGTTLKLYINNSLVASKVVLLTPYYTTSKFRVIGTSFASVDETYLYARVLTNDEMEAIANET